jgi:hypothetical protein
MRILLIDAMKDIRKITDPNTDGVKETRLTASSLMDQAKRISESIEREKR